MDGAENLLRVKAYYETKSSEIDQSRHRKKFNFSTFPNRNQIFKLVENFEAHGSCKDLRVTRSSPSGPIVIPQKTSLGFKSQSLGV